MPARPRSPAEAPLRRGIVLILTSTVVYGSTPALVHLTNRSVGLIDLIFYRSALAALVLALLSRVVRRRLTADPSPERALGLRGIALGVLLFGPHLLLFLGSLQRLDSSLAVAIGYVYPSFVIGLIALRGRRPPARSDVMVLSLALIGVVAVAAPPGGAAVDPVGVVMVVGAAGLFAAYAVVTADLVAEVDPIRLACHLLVGVAVLVGTVGVATGRLSHDLDGATMLLLVAHAALTVVGILAYTSGLAVVGAARASLIDTFQPVVALVVGMTLLAERPGPVQYAGVLLIVGSIVVTSLRLRRPQPPVVDSI